MEFYVVVAVKLVLSEIVVPRKDVAPVVGDRVDYGHLGLLVLAAFLGVAKDEEFYGFFDGFQGDGVDWKVKFEVRTFFLEFLEFEKKTLFWG